jgi:hypothetical protein
VTFLLSLLLLTQTPIPVQKPADFLYSVNPETKEFRILGQFINEPTCIQVAAILTQRAEAEQSKVRFYCAPLHSST